MSTTAVQPTVYVQLGKESWLAFDERGEIIETNTVEENDLPDWLDGGIADHRGAAGAEGFKKIHEALTLLEDAAKLSGLEVVRVLTP